MTPDVDNGASNLAVGPSPALAWYTTLVLFVLTVIAMADRLAISMLIGPIKHEFGVGDFQASLLVGAAFSLFYTIFLVPIGWASDHFSRRRVLFVCLAIWTFASVACGFAGSLLILFAMRMLVGAGEAGLAPSAHGIIGQNFPHERLAKPLALQSVGMQVGAAIGVAASGAILSAGATGAFAGIPIIADMSPWRVAFIAIGMPGLIALALVPTLHDPSGRPDRRAKSDASAPSVRPFLKRNWAMMALLYSGAGISAMAFGSVSAWMPEFMQREYAISPAEAGASLGMIMLAAAVLSQATFSALIDYLAGKGRLDAPLTVGIGPVAIAAVVAIVAYSADSTNAFLFWQFILLFLIIPCGGIYNTAVQQIAPPALRSRLSSLLILSISLLGFGAGPAMVGWLSEFVVGADRLGTAIAIVMSGALCVTLVIVLLTIAPFVRYQREKPGLQ